MNAPLTVKNFVLAALLTGVYTVEFETARFVKTAGLNAVYEIVYENEGEMESGLVFVNLDTLKADF